MLLWRVARMELLREIRNQARFRATATIQANRLMNDTGLGGFVDEDHQPSAARTDHVALHGRSIDYCIRWERREGPCDDESFGCAGRRSFSICATRCISESGNFAWENCGRPRGYRLMLTRQEADSSVSDPVAIAASMKVLVEVSRDEPEIDWPPLKRRSSVAGRVSRNVWSARDLWYPRVSA